jgi:hypothetical protein
MTPVARAIAVAVLGTIVLAAAPSGAGGQSCGLAAGGVSVGGAVGGAHYQAAGGQTGASVGGDIAFGSALGSLRASYRTVILEGHSPQIGRLTAAVPLPLPIGAVRLCGVGHGGASRLAVEGEAVTVLAGGIGLRLALPMRLGGGMAAPYVEIRGLSARSAGELLGVDLGASGLGLGGEGGARLSLGPLTAAFSVSADGFASGLGLTPYPSAVGELMLGIRF